MGFKEKLICLTASGYHWDSLRYVGRDTTQILLGCPERWRNGRLPMNHTAHSRLQWSSGGGGVSVPELRRLKLPVGCCGITITPWVGGSWLVARFLLITRLAPGWDSSNRLTIFWCYPIDDVMLGAGDDADRLMLSSYLPTAPNSGGHGAGASGAMTSTHHLSTLCCT